MTLREFLRMWRADKTVLVLESTRRRGPKEMRLYSALLPYSSDYGRHLAILLEIDRSTREVLNHELINLSGWIAMSRADVDKAFARFVRSFGLPRKPTALRDGIMTFYPTGNTGNFYFYTGAGTIATTQEATWRASTGGAT